MREVRASGCLSSTTGRLPGKWPPAPDNKQTLCAGRSKRPDTNVGEERGIGTGKPASRRSVAGQEPLLLHFSGLGVVRPSGRTLTADGRWDRPFLAAIFPELTTAVRPRRCRFNGAAGCKRLLGRGGR